MLLENIYGIVVTIRKVNRGFPKLFLGDFHEHSCRILKSLVGNLIQECEKSVLQMILFMSNMKDTVLAFDSVASAAFQLATDKVICLLTVNFQQIFNSLALIVP